MVALECNFFRVAYWMFFVYREDCTSKHRATFFGVCCTMASLSGIRWLLYSTFLFSFLECESANGNHTKDQPFPFSNMSDVSLCACHDSQHRIYNLASLAKSGGPRFTAKAKDSYWYSYNPCKSFTLGTFGDCSGGDVAICRWTNDTSYTDIGSQRSEKCGHTSQRTMKLVYTKGSQWHSEVHLKCDPERKSIQSAEFTVITDVKAGAMKFCLKHNCACPDGCPKDPTKRPSVTTPQYTAWQSTRTTAPSRTTKKTTRAITEKATSPSRTSGKTSSSTNGTTGFSLYTMYTFVPPFQGFPYESQLTPLAISLVALGIVFFVMLAVLSIRFCIRRWGHNDGNDVMQHLLAGAQSAVHVTKNTFPKSDDGGRTKNLLNAYLNHFQ
ncbi:uncharacterized protein [Montipora foliosa]|uniref:uncharacterized protein isoform X1 n=1 Tax=Montipora foliosa TaxID=591990 RepID=UPI0035F2027F